MSCPTHVMSQCQNVSLDLSLYTMGAGLLNQNVLALADQRLDPESNTMWSAIGLGVQGMSPFNTVK